jgi:hypothetical protein
MGRPKPCRGRQPACRNQWKFCITTHISPEHLSGAFGTIFTLLPGGQSYLEIQSDLDESRLPLQQISQLSTLQNPDQIRCVLELVGAGNCPQTGSC